MGPQGDPGSMVLAYGNFQRAASATSGSPIDFSFTSKSYLVSRVGAGRYRFELEGDYLVSWNIAVSGTGEYNLVLSNESQGSYPATRVTLQGTNDLRPQTGQAIVTVGAQEVLSLLSDSSSQTFAEGALTFLRVGPGDAPVAQKFEALTVSQTVAAQSLSASVDGRLVAYTATESGRGFSDVFVYDRIKGTSAKVSVSSTGVEANGESDEPSLSADGRYVAFISEGTNLGGGTTATADVFVHDLELGTTTQVSLNSAGGFPNSPFRSPSLSDDGRFVAFTTSANNIDSTVTSNGKWQIYVRDLKTGINSAVSITNAGLVGDENSLAPSISADGRYVAFKSAATNLVAGDANLYWDIYVHDRLNRTTRRVSVSSTGGDTNGNSDSCSISANGRFVAFNSTAGNLVSSTGGAFAQTYVRDLETEQTSRVSVSSLGEPADGRYQASAPRPSLSGEGRYAMFSSQSPNLVANDTNGTWDVFVHDRKTGATSLLSQSPLGVVGNAASDYGTLSQDGTTVLFLSSATNLISGATPGNLSLYVSNRHLP